MGALVGDLARLIIGAYLDPRASVRQILGRGTGFQTGFLLSLLGWLIGSVILTLAGGPVAPPEPGAPAPQVTVLVTLGVAVLMFMACSWLIWRVGRGFGGRGTLDQAFVVMGWNNLVGSPLTLLQVMAGSPLQMAAAGPGQVAIMALYAGAMFWLLAASIAEMHVFASTWRVLAFVLLVPLVLGFAFAILSAMMGGSPNV